MLFYVGEKLKVVCHLFIVSLDPSTPSNEKLPVPYKELRIYKYMASFTPPPMIKRQFVVPFELVNYACASRVIVDGGENVSFDRSAVSLMQMRYARGLLLNPRPCLTQGRCSKGLN